ncbi:hypothetical protein D3C75_746840 [compost metagenome]
MAVRTDEGVRINHTIFFDDTLSQILKINLMANAYAWGDDFESLECLHAPLHQLVALSVALEFNLHVLTQRIGNIGKLGLHRVIHHQMNRHHWLNSLGIRATFFRLTAHSSQVGQ